MMKGWLRSARRAPLLSLVMVIALGNAVAFWMMAEAAHDVEVRQLETSRPALYRVVAAEAPLAPAAPEPWLLHHWSALLLPLDAAQAVRTVAPGAVTATFQASLPVGPSPGQLSELNVRFTTRELFGAFGRTPLRGAPWSIAADVDAGVREVVIRDTAARRWFGEGDPVGQAVYLAGTAFTVVGTVARGDGQPYDLRFAGDDDEVFVPWAQVSALPVLPTLSVPAGGFVNVWAEPGPGQAEAFAERLRPACRLMSYRELWERSRLSDPAVELFRLFALFALAACAFNLMRLMWTRFLLEAPTVAVHRALGASRALLFRAHLFEAATLGAAAAAIAPPLAWAGVQALNALMLKRVGDYRIDAPLALAGAGVALLTGIASGLWPAWQVSRTSAPHHLGWS